MYVVIVGLSASGTNLARMLIERKYDVAVIDKDEDRCKEFAAEVDALIIHGDAEDQDILINAGIKNAQALVAATDDDSVNLLVVTMAKEFKIPSLVVILRDPDHAGLFQKIDVKTVMPDEIVAEHIYHLLFTVTDFFCVDKGKFEVFALLVSERSKAVGKKLKQIKLPNGYNIVGIIRNEKLVAGQDPVLEIGDNIILHGSRKEDIKSVIEFFRG